MDRKWICERVDGTGEAKETPIGLLPSPGALDLAGLDISLENQQELLRVDAENWKKEVQDAEAYFSQFGGKMPKELNGELRALVRRLADVRQG